MSRRTRTAAAALLTIALALVSCTGGPPDPGTATPPPSGSSPGPDPSTSASGATATATPTSPTTTSLVPLTPEGLQTGPGVDADRITLGLIIDPDADRGFEAGVRLWQSMINSTTGVCGRRIELRAAASVGSIDSALTGYRELGPDTLGLITLTSSTVQAALAPRIAEDQLPVISPVGRAADLSPWGPMVVGATDDLLMINAESHLLQAGTLRSGGELGVLTDGSADAAEEEAGLRWFAARANVTLRVFTDPATADWAGLPAVAVLADPTWTRQVLATTASDVTVVTTLDGYDPTTFDPAWHARLLVSTPTTALNSDNPTAKAVITAFGEAGGTNPGPLLFAGYATGTTWGRLLQQACSQAELTRSGIRAAATELSPAPADSLLGATDLRPLVTDGLPATRVSAISVADPQAPGGLSALTWLQAAPGIADYVAGG